MYFSPRVNAEGRGSGRSLSSTLGGGQDIEFGLGRTLLQDLPVMEVVLGDTERDELSFDLVRMAAWTVREREREREKGSGLRKNSARGSLEPKRGRSARRSG